MRAMRAAMSARVVTDLATRREGGADISAPMLTRMAVVPRMGATLKVVASVRALSSAVW